MGSTVPVAASVPVRIQASDGDNEIFTEVILFDKNHNKRRIWHPNAAAVDVADTLRVAVGDYYYVKVTEQDTGEAISSPIWISGPSF
jgi:predicted secreted protein